MSVLAKTVGYTAAAVAGVCVSSIFVVGVFLLYQAARSI